MGSVTHVYEWFDGALRWRVPFDEVGQGAPVLCLPAPSTISTREEMRGLAERLARGRRVFLIDWPGFGEADRLPIRYRAPLFSRFLRAFVAQFAEPVDVVAAGHAAGYVLAVAPAAARRFGRLVFLAPTWRGPLPTAMGPHPRVWSALEALVRAPILGSLLYSANASRPFVRLMMRRHVFAEEPHLTAALLDARVRVAHRPNARFAAAAFVTGGLDMFASRSDYLNAASACAAPIFVAMGDRTPPKSLAEMQALAALPNVQSTTVPGAIAFYDEYPEAAAVAVAAFLDAA